MTRRAHVAVIGVLAFLALSPLMSMGQEPPRAPSSDSPGGVAVRTAAEPGQALVVAIRSYPPGRSGEARGIASRGAGIVLGLWLPTDRASSLAPAGTDRIPPAPPDTMVLIGTADHVLESGPGQEGTYVFFAGVNPGLPFSDSIGALVLERAAPQGLDLALLAVPLTSVRDRAFLGHQDRRGNPRTLRPGSEVNPVGCPDNFAECWTVPSPPNQVLFVGADIVFDTRFVRVGSSGGALFNSRDEIVGMVRTNQPPSALAIPIDQVVNQVQGVWGYPVRLEPPTVPRDGYRITAGAAILLPPTPGDDLSVRATGTFRINSGTNVRGTLLRLAPDSLGANCRFDATRAPCEVTASALLGGFDLGVRASGLGASAYAEVGFARSEGRYDSGGVGVGGVYRPAWITESQTGLAVGGGVTVDWLPIPHLILDVTLGGWSVPDPFTEVPSQAGIQAQFPTLFVAFGARYGF